MVDISYERRVYESVEDRSQFSGYISKIDERQNSGSKGLKKRAEIIDRNWYYKTIRTI